MSDEYDPITNPDQFIEEDVPVEEFLRNTDLPTVELAPGEVGLVVHPEVEMSDITREDGKTPSCTVTFSTNKLARDGCVLDAAGLDVKHYRRNPVVLFAHDYRSLPIAKSPNVQYIKGTSRSGDKWAGKPQFHLQTDLSREVWWLIENGYLRAWSLGFIVRKYKRLKPSEVGIKKENSEESDVVDARRVWDRFVETELLEYSSVPVPADPHALTNSLRELRTGGRSLPAIEATLRAQGFEVPELVPHEVRTEDEPDEDVVLDEEFTALADEDVADCERPAPDENEKTIRIRVRDPKLFVDGSFRTIDISKDQGIKSVIGKLKSAPKGSTKIQNYMFAKAKGWTVAKATAWVKKHKKGIDEMRDVIAVEAGDPDTFGFRTSDEHEFVFVVPAVNEPAKPRAVQLKSVADILRSLRRK